MTLLALIGESPGKAGSSVVAELGSLEVSFWAGQYTSENTYCAWVDS